jgi:hypothetical protein
VYGFVTDRIDVLEDAAVKPEVRSKLQADMKQLAGLKGEAVVTPRGLSKSAEFQIPAGAGPHMAETIDSMRQSMRQLATPFPIEPVGRGAKWKTTSTIRTKAFSFVQVTTYTLVSESEGRAMLDIKLEQRADSQVVKLDGMPPDVTTTLDSFHGRGAGHPTLDFDRLTPDSESEIEAHARFKAEHGGEAVSFGNDFRINFKIRSN